VYLSASKEKVCLQADDPRILFGSFHSHYQSPRHSYSYFTSLPDIRLSPHALVISSPQIPVSSALRLPTSTYSDGGFYEKMQRLGRKL
jgi:hypothetical protein